MAKSMIHLNGHILCSVDVETTGFTAGYHDVVQVAILPLDSEIKPRTDVNAFYIMLKPKRPENADPKAMAVSKLSLAQLILEGIDPDDGAELFVEWFNNLGLAVNKKIAPLASNWIFDSGFIKDWLGEIDFNARFHFHYRDTQPLALYMNDRYAFHAEKPPFNRVGVGNLAEHFGIVNLQAHDALQDCVTSAEIYRRMCTMFCPLNMGAYRPIEVPDGK